jgi:Na+-translocating ferredoxin:NAD+ oxidoreductase subunit E
VSADRDGFVPNPLLAGLVGLAPVAVVSRSLVDGLVYGLGAAFCSISLGSIVPAIRNSIPDRLQAQASIAASAALAVLYSCCVSLFSPTVASSLWIYLPLLAASGLSLATLRRVRATERYGPDGSSRLIGISIEAIAFMFTSALVGAARELLAYGMLSLPIPGLAPLRISFAGLDGFRFLASPAGGFILLGFLVAAYKGLARSTRGRRSR